MSKLKQNNLEESTTDIGFVKVINENKGETIVALQKEIELEDGTTAIVENITPSKMKQVLNSMVDGNEGAITYETPGEEYEGRDGVVQIYNDSVIAPDLVSIEITTEPTKTVYTEGETFDSEGMVVTATYSNETTKEITDYEISPSEELATTDTEITISYGGKTATQTITVNEAEEQSTKTFNLIEVEDKSENKDITALGEVKFNAEISEDKAKFVTNVNVSELTGEFNIHLLNDAYGIAISEFGCRPSDFTQNKDQNYEKEFNIVYTEGHSLYDVTSVYIEYLDFQG